MKGKAPEILFALSNDYAGVVQDRCVLYAFRCAVYFAQTPPEHREKEKLNWWFWKD
ncbi:helix-hairpin-helix domain-containing protein [Prevotella sp. oral taxon 376]|uniref:helix-hairpin-helix domain-containing protein n=1 Tax=Prevotella sp. oral taxon 376 TaxID=712466 RepID=UPI001E49769D|nr:helix-hairpin-helix domain-containing protein [Prevotella sp. oral taxon 376]